MEKDFQENAKLGGRSGWGKRGRGRENAPAGGGNQFSPQILFFFCLLLLLLPKIRPQGPDKGGGGKRSRVMVLEAPFPSLRQSERPRRQPSPDPWHCSRKSQPGRQPPGSPPPPPPSVDPRPPPFPREEIGSQGRGKGERKSHFSIPSPTSSSPFPSQSLIDAFCLWLRMVPPCNLRPHTEIEGVSVARRVGGKKEISRRGEKEGEEGTPAPLRRDYDGVKRSRNGGGGGGGGGFGSFLSSAAARGMGIWGKISGSERERTLFPLPILHTSNRRTPLDTGQNRGTAFHFRDSMDYVPAISSSLACGGNIKESERRGESKVGGRSGRRIPQER